MDVRTWLMPYHRKKGSVEKLTHTLLSGGSFVVPPDKEEELANDDVKWELRL